MTGALAWLSSAWFDAVNEAAAVAVGPAATQAAGQKLVVQQRIVGGPRGDVGYTLRLDGDRLHVSPGIDPSATVTVTQDHETAAAVVRGELRASTAFLDGRIRIRGDMAALTRASDALAGVDALFADVRARTTVGPST